MDHSNVGTIWTNRELNYNVNNSIFIKLIQYCFTTDNNYLTNIEMVQINPKTGQIMGLRSDQRMESRSDRRIESRLDQRLESKLDQIMESKMSKAWNQGLVNEFRNMLIILIKGMSNNSDQWHANNSEHSQWLWPVSCPIILTRDVSNNYDQLYAK